MLLVIETIAERLSSKDRQAKALEDSQYKGKDKQAKDQLAETKLFEELRFVGVFKRVKGVGPWNVFTETQFNCFLLVNTRHSLSEGNMQPGIGNSQ